MVVVLQLVFDAPFLPAGRPNTLSYALLVSLHTRPLVLPVKVLVNFRAVGMYCKSRIVKLPQYLFSASDRDKDVVSK